MSKEKKRFLSNRNLIKWYEYTMDYGNKDDNAESENESEAISDEMLEEEEIARKMAELDDGEQALVADIMARFADAKQSLVDGLFDDDFTPSEVNEEDLISQICAPKQSNVDSFINMARTDESAGN